MKSKYLVFISVILLSIISCQQGESEKHDTNSTENIKTITQDEVDPVVNKWLNLWATYDLNLLEEIFYQSEDLTYFSSEKEGLIKGYSNMLPHHEGFGFVEGGKEPPVDLWLEEIETRINGETALVAAIWYNGDKTAVHDSIPHGPVTFVMLRDDAGKVKISHAHFANN